ncbi:2Fe-2S iron-sulfur cluster-binding protein [Halogeometricum luteum]|uniref:2Fe-2S iron-sulfur cluster-binding protein n=1 Tax=Halogeometricum luteum TaxID=2950537 RepID=A0ABU2G044_9EURY|nr:2Fe-2S iron-sulfur cluster-binding protein [Halogeometricum sp. S3BR5-2]MDS0293856.1 2Fe-2S iron-sulfur cluster-binding protein [Halogeometricum sp. S3BR5-2]
MVEISLLGLGLGVTLTLLAVSLHFSRGTAWTPTADISQDVLERRASTVPETDFPEPMNRSIGGGGVAAGAVGEGEEGGELEGEAEEESTSPADIPEDEVEYFEVEYAKQGSTIEVANNQTLLEAGEDEGWDLPYACRQGQCVSCAGQVTSGGNSEDYVVHDNQQMLDDAEMDEGYTLTCVAYPKADLTLETGEAP